MKTKTTLSNSLAFLAALLWAAPAAAYIEVNPTVLKPVVPAGGTYSAKVKVRNPTETALEITPGILDWKYSQPDGSKDFLAKGSSKFSCAKWISVALDKFTLKPGEERTVNFTLSVPPDAAGGYYSLIMFGALKPKAQSSQKVEIGVSIDVPLLLMLEVDKTQKPKGVVRKLEAVSPQANRPFDIRVDFRNEGNVRVEAKGRLSIVDAGGSPLGWVKVPDLKTLPGDSWSVTAPWEYPLPPGNYLMVATFELSSGGLLVQEKELLIP